MTDSLSDRALLMLKRSQMTTEQIRAGLGTSRSTANNVIKHLRNKGLVCIVRYEKTGVKPVAYFGLGNTDALRPSPMTRDEKNQRKRDARRMQRGLAVIVPSGPRRDIAASWI